MEQTRAIFETAAGNPENQDRAAIVNFATGLVLAIADGAGGSSGGAQAATMSVEYARQHAHELDSPDACVNLLGQMDKIIAKDQAAGETTCVVAVLTDAQVYGASVGDSEAWVVGKDGIIRLTQGQSRKPFIGSGAAHVVPFSFLRVEAASLLLATDGLVKYAGADRIANVCLTESGAGIGRKLIELVRYPSGAMPDDVSVIVAQL